MSFAQQRLWFIDKLERGSAFYNLPLAVTLSGHLDVSALERTLTEVVRRHEVLRTRFVEVNGEPVQVIEESAPLHLPVTDLGEFIEAEREAEVWRLAQAEASTAFDLSRGPLLRVQLLRLGETEHVVLLTLHHIITDGWSTGVLIKEVATLYAAYRVGETSPLPELELQYGDYAAWQRGWLQGEVLEAQLRYWQRQLGGELPVLELPSDRPRPAVQSYRGASSAVSLSSNLTEALQELSRREGVTLFMTLLAAFQVLLYRYSGQRDVLVGTPIAGRGLGKSEEAIGYFANTLVLRTAVTGEQSFRELLRQVREVALEAYAHQETPFEKVVEAVQPKRELSHHPLFQVLFALHNLPAQEIALSDLTLSWMEAEHRTSRFDLALELRVRGEGIGGKLEYSTDLFEAETVERLLEHYENLLASVVAAPEQQLSELGLLSAGEREQILVEWNATEAEYDSSRCLHELVEEQAARRPEAVAVCCEEEQVTYDELNRRANQLAHYLRQQGVGQEILVGILLERSVEMVVAVLGVLKAGGAYVPLDPVYPSERLRFMLEDAAVPVLLTQRHLVANVPESKAKVIVLDEELIAEQSATNPVPLTTPDNLAYIIYTSGSTGQPKGVQIEHRALINFLTAMGERPGLSASDVFLSVTSLSFDIAGLELFLPLLTGARVVVASREEVVDGGLLIARLESSGATVMQATPATWQLLLEAGWQGDASLRVLCGGEAMEARLAQELAARSRELWNLYGPTETTIWSSVSKVDGRSPVTIGVPIANTQLYVLDEHWQAVPIGVAGELYIAGDGLARGYLQRPELTAEKFVANPYSGRAGARMYRTGDLVRYRRTGELEYLGRLDQQVKLRGYRIELGEIESALLSHSGISKCVVIAREESKGQKRLVGYVVLDEAGELDQQWQRELREHLRKRLPEYMIPAAFVQLEALPLTANGKLDRRALPAPEATENRRETELPITATAVEEVLLGLWQEVLRVKVVGRGDNFFEFGGHSLLATQLLSRAREAFGVEVTLRKLFEEPTVAGLAAHIEQLLKDGTGITAPPVTRVPRDRPVPLSFAQQRLWFIDKLERGSAFYNLPVAVALSGELDVDALEQTVTEVVRRHEVLRTRFVEVNGEPVQVIEESAPLHLPVTDLGEFIEAEREAEVWRLAQAEASTAFDLSRGPLLRVQLLRLGETEHVVLLTLHHIITDGWSTGVLIKEVATLYAAYRVGETSPLPELELQYGDYAAWQRGWLQGEVLEAQLRYWQRQLGGELPVLELPSDRPRPAVQSYRGASSAVSLSSNLTEALQELSRREGVTLFMTLLAAFQVLLYRYSGQRDVLVGTPIAGRGLGKSEEAIGYFANTLVLRTTVNGEQSFRELLRQVREVALEAYAHQETPFEKVVEAVQPKRELSHHPLFQVLFALHNLPAQEIALSDLTLSWMEAEHRTSRFDLALELRVRGEGIGGKLEYSTDLFEAETVERLLEHYENLLASVVAAPEQQLSELSILSAGEREQILVEWNATEAEYESSRCLHELVEEQAARRPEAVAVCHEEEQVTYGELNGRANQLAHYLRKLGIGTGDLVAICVERSVEMIVGVLGILKAGAAYVPLDPSYPEQRLAFMMADTQAPVLLTQAGLVSELPEIEAQVVCLDQDWEEISAESETNVGRATTAEDLAYVIYTSGSTGRPKGVMVSHESVVHLFQGLQPRIGFDEQDVWSVFHSYAFDFSVWEIWGCLSSGGRLVLVPTSSDL